ncbi:hypothetical protein EI171_22445 [Bradyrhizobium sp. LCT2]|uniref:hypothetical protein n=1 Tax=Bradyrhizobium sp. LCT2 TaxID=2493093 RepID=UPI0013741CF9|nr:hypothetical protein [Bradyrhizobium sp. LCT2]QHP69811.1 hypothetical protein EI171_22445 [Bradyrhizobium sp. LCT2]
MAEDERDNDQAQKSGRSCAALIDRLRASKSRAEAADTTRGEQAGRLWAEKYADYQWLQRLADETCLRSQPFETLRAAIDPNEQIDPSEVHEICFGDDNDTSNEYIAGFIDGAVETFAGVRHEID